MDFMGPSCHVGHRLSYPAFHHNNATAPLPGSFLRHDHDFEFIQLDGSLAPVACGAAPMVLLVPSDHIKDSAIHSRMIVEVRICILAVICIVRTMNGRGAEM
jgi:hypothetical protein